MIINDYIKFDGTVYYCDIKRKNIRIRKKSRLKSDVAEYIKLKLLQEKIKNTPEKIVVDFEYIFNEYYKNNCMNWATLTKSSRQMWFKNYFQSIKNVKLEDFNLDSLSKWCEETKNKIKSKNTINKNTPYLLKIYHFMRTLLKYAIENKYMKKLDLTILHFKINQKNSNIQDDYITEEEMKIICDNIQNETVSPGQVGKDFLVLFIKFLFYTGCRINEARAVQVRDVQKQINPHGEKTTVTYQVVFEKQIIEKGNSLQNTKNKSVRYTFLEQSFYQEIMIYCDKYKLDLDDFIFVPNYSTLPYTRKAMSYTMKRVISTLKKKNLLSARVPDEFHPHCFRYSNTLYFKKRGVPYTLAAYMRGQSPYLMLKTYDRIDKAEVLEIFSKKNLNSKKKEL